MGLGCRYINVMSQVYEVPNSSIFLYNVDTAIVGFSSSSCCAYAKEALHGFEYPPGCPLDIEYYDNNSNTNR